MKNLINKLRPTQVDLLVYYSPKSSAQSSKQIQDLPFPVKESPPDTFNFLDGDLLAHKSKVFKGSRILKSFGFGGELMCIGDCVTPSEFRGQGLYPTMLSYLSQRFVDSRIYILVSPHNIASIKGIEKADFFKIARIKCLKIGPIYLNKSQEKFAQV